MGKHQNDDEDEPGHPSTNGHRPGRPFPDELDGGQHADPDDFEVDDETPPEDQ